MSRTWEPWLPGSLVETPEPCRSCIEWQLDPRDVRRRPPTSEERMAMKSRWLGEASQAEAAAGLLLRRDGEVAGFIAWAVPQVLPRLGAVPTAPASPDAVILVGLHAADPSLYKVLVQRVARELSGQGVRALEAFAGGPAVPGCLSRPPAAGGPCRIPAQLLDRIGFHVERGHPASPRYRLEIAGAVAVLDRWEQSISGLAQALRRHPGAEPSLGRDADAAP